MPDLRTWGPATVLIVVLVSIAVVVGGIVVIVQPATLDFAHYLDDLEKFAIALGILGVGRGIHAAATNDATADGPIPLNAIPDTPPGEPDPKQ